MNILLVIFRVVPLFKKDCHVQILNSTGCHYLTHKFISFVLTHTDQLVMVCGNLYEKIERPVFFFINVLVLG